MASKLSDGETKEGSSSEPQETKAMETSSTDVASSLLGKRKGENEGDVDEEEDSDSDWEWDKDSFDGKEYHSSDDTAPFLDDDHEKRTRFYYRTVIETKGFFKSCDKFPRYLWGGIATVPGLDKMMRLGVTVRQFLANMTCLCVEKYNKRKRFNVKFERVLRANFNPGGKTKYYITFAARESDSLDAPLVEYQAKVARSAGNTYPILCRPTSPRKFVEDDGGDQLETGNRGEGRERAVEEFHKYCCTTC